MTMRGRGCSLTATGGEDEKSGREGREGGREGGKKREGG